MNNQRPVSNMPPLRPMGGPGGPGGGRGPMGARVGGEKPKNMLKTLGRLLRYVGKSRLLIFLLLGIMVIVTLSDLAGPALQGAAISTITVSEGGLSVDLDAMLGYLTVMGIMFAVRSKTDMKAFTFYIFSKFCGCFKFSYFSVFFFHIRTCFLS